MKPGDRVRITTTDGSYDGILMPPEASTVILKLDTGYNIGIPTRRIKEKKVLKEYKEKKSKKSSIKQKKGLPHITLLHTGGTIASKVDYGTGGVIARFEPEELLQLFPEIRDYANITSRLVSNMWSEDMRFAHYNVLAREVEKEIKKGVQGIIITHGTDTLHYTSAALAFALENCPVPVLLVGAQRSSDRPSSDAAMNVICAARFIAETDFCGVALAMHEHVSDDTVLILPACKSRKMHASRRDAFQAINALPLARIHYHGKISLLSAHPVPSGPFALQLFKEKLKVGILRGHTNMYASQFLAFKDFDGLILEGTGIAGNVPINHIDKYTGEHKKIATAIKQLIKNGTLVAAATQTIHGRVHMDVYQTGRDMQKLGILGNKLDMTAETAFIKLAWLLSNFKKDEVASLYEQNLRGEISERQVYDSYP
ncbi:Glu-tRNA(Gln) amidotransferase subunit GatD [Candidatus Woesearchaeota archaeon]|nr:Glu-tRNA(Gln) amidotransferase subunit GatD [Candidatus Woesearchaeota archaeon]